MKEASSDFKAQRPLEDWFDELRQYSRTRWTKKKDNQLLLAVAKSSHTNNFPDFEKLADVLGRDDYPPDELEYAPKSSILKTANGFSLEEVASITWPTTVRFVRLLEPLRLLRGRCLGAMLRSTNDLMEFDCQW